MLPVTADAESDKFVSLAINIILCELVAGIAELGYRHFLAVDLILLDYGTFDRHSVVVPTGNVRCLIPLHRFGFDYHVLEYLVHRGTHVDIAVREGRTVVKNEFFVSLVVFEHEGIKVYLIPVFEHFRLALMEVSAHCE